LKETASDLKEKGGEKYEELKEKASDLKDYAAEKNSRKV